MTRLTVHTPATAPEGSRAFIDTVITNNGFLPNLIGVLANAPAALETYLTVSGINARASLSLAEREVVQITAASVHGCDFCVAGHTAIALKKAGLERDLVRALQERASTGNARFDALVAFTRAVILTRGNVGKGELADFQAAGFGEQQVLEVILGVSLATLCNFANNLAGTGINPELQAYRPGALEA
ncbi:MAG: carboxymuconolactone decarboxylase family protein [Proteobacteria bacterium]|nr:carboxymuconolactone decarboxylase family protein [Pseudomonadota bacterium]